MLLIGTELATDERLELSLPSDQDSTEGEGEDVDDGESTSYMILYFYILFGIFASHFTFPLFGERPVTLGGERTSKRWMMVLVFTGNIKTSRSVST